VEDARMTFGELVLFFPIAILGCLEAADCGGGFLPPAARLQELHARKAQAVAAEDYDEAKRLKLAFERLAGLGAQIAALEAKKLVGTGADWDNSLGRARDAEGVLRALMRRELCAAGLAMKLQSNLHA
jgi:hypothetical protein